MVDGHVQVVPSCRRRRAERVHAARRGSSISTSAGPGHGDGAYVHACVPRSRPATRAGRRCGVNGRCPVSLLSPP